MIKKKKVKLLNVIQKSFFLEEKKGLFIRKFFYHLNKGHFQIFVTAFLLLSNVPVIYMYKLNKPYTTTYLPLLYFNILI